MPLRLYNTLTRRVEPVIPADPARVTFYSCGPTVYDDAHIGNFRSFLAADVLRRWIESPLCDLEDGRGGVHAGPRRVIHVMNITDVGHMTDDAEGGESGEDRMEVAGRRLAEAKKAGNIPEGVTIDPNDPYQIARFYEDRFKEDGRKLGLKLIAEGDQDPTLNPRATENIPGMIAVIQALLRREFAYVRGSRGSRVVYFDVQQFPDYGQLSGNTLEELQEGAGGRINTRHQLAKKHPADFLLWKEDPSHIMGWKASFEGQPWERGYPGWHIECTVMSAGRLDDQELHRWWRDQLVRYVRMNADAIGIREGNETTFVHNYRELLHFLRCEGIADKTAGGRVQVHSDAAVLAAFLSARMVDKYRDHDIPQYPSSSPFDYPGIPSKTTVYDRLTGRDRRQQTRASRTSGQNLQRLYAQVRLFLRANGCDSEPLGGLRLNRGMIDIHSGGEDNIFPHHECEIAQSCAAFGADPKHGTFARHWFHPRFLLVNGVKMSKSKGNFYTARDLFEKGVEPAAVRLELIKTHYRSNANFTLEGLKSSGFAIERWRDHARLLNQVRALPLLTPNDPVPNVAREFCEAMNEDLNVSKAVALLHQLVSAGGFFGSAADAWQRTQGGRELDSRAWSEIRAMPLPASPLGPVEATETMQRGIERRTLEGAWGLLNLIDSVLGVIFVPQGIATTASDIGVFIGLEPSAEVNAKLEARRAARAAKDFKTSDQIRDELRAMGYAIKDVAGGKVEVTRL